MNNTTLNGEYLGLIIDFNELLGKTILKAEYFEGKDRILFEILKTEYDKNKVLVLDNLKKYNKFDMDYYFKFYNTSLEPQKERRFEILEQNIIEQYKKRELLKIVKEYKGNQEDFYKNIEKIKNIKYRENKNITIEKTNEILGKKKTKIKLGYSDIDKKLKIFKNDFVVIAGGTGTGKTTFALNLLSNMSKEYKCIYFNMEMSEENLYQRLYSIETGLNIDKLDDIETLQVNESKILFSKMSEIEERKITLINGSQTLENIQKEIILNSDERELIVFLDHIGLIKCKGNSLYERMTEIAKEIRSLCLDYNCTIFGLCQLSRESQKEEKQPKLQNLRDSGEIEQSARKVLLLYNKDVKNESEIKNVDLIIAKNDAGNYGIKEFKFDTKKQKFMEVENGR